MTGQIKYLLLICFWITCACEAATAQSLINHGAGPGPASARIESGHIVLENALLTMEWSLLHSRILGTELIGRASHEKIALSPRNLFVLRFSDGSVLRSSNMQPQGDPRVEAVSANPNALNVAQRFAGQQVSIKLQDPKRKLAVTWKAILRDDSNYLRQEVAVEAGSDASITEVELFHFASRTARVSGTVKGSPVVMGDVFLGFEHPLSTCQVKSETVTCTMSRELPLRTGQTVTYSSVIGLSSGGQMRRDFLNYLERERARPYSPFLTYNSWYDIGYNNPYDQAAALDVIHSLGKELVTQRGVRLDSFLFDDGWDDPRTLWSFGAGFPDGFSPVTAAAEKYGAEPGVWLSPWGGYDQAKEERLKYGREQGLEIMNGGFALSGPKYFERFRDVTLKFLETYKVNQFKIDGTGNANSVLPGSQFDSDFQAAISLMEEWRSVNPKVFINLTTGTYPSPFWLRYADSIWRGGEDHDFTGVGTWRERWITYRDAATYKQVVVAGPLFPLNSLMLHGIIYARQAEHLGSDPGNDFAHEVHSYFGSGTQMQELYITHSLLTRDNWDSLAEAGRWARENADVQRDTHWIGGDPALLQVYGWAAWSPEKGIITLRNPSDKPQDYELDIGKALDLPQGTPHDFKLHSPWAADRDSPSLHCTSGKNRKISVRPFEVMTWEALPD
jgi:hypothetical protein